ALGWPGPARGTLAMARTSGHPVVGRLLGDADVVDVTFPHAGIGDAHEHRAGAHVADVAAAGIAHGSAPSARELVQARGRAPLAGPAALAPLGHQLLELGGGVLEVTIRRAMTLRHRAERPHAAIGLVGGALVELDLAGRLLGAGE